MRKLVLGAAAIWIVFATVAVAEEREPKPLAKPGDTYVAIEYHGCLGTCPAFDLYVFDNGHLVFRGNNRYTARRGTVHRTVDRKVYQRLVTYLETHPIFDERPECPNWWTDHPGITAISTSRGQPQQAYWYFGCERDSDTAQEIFETFVIETNTAGLVDRDTREWEKLSVERKKAAVK
jgi:hypothetical protein